MADTKTKQNYTADMVELMLNMYTRDQEQGRANAGLEEIADAVKRPVRSVISKLVREGVYVATPKGPKAAKAEGPTKKELLRELESLVSFPVDGLTGATKEALEMVITLARSVEAETESEAA
jgi:DNA polymerase I-like protein with 3'-5' exonuclease and polymerase domains